MQARELAGWAVGPIGVANRVERTRQGADYLGVASGNIIMHAFSRQEQDCIEACLNCHKVCLGLAMTHCLDEGGEHVAPQHFRLMMDCATICATAADFLMHKSQFHRPLCRLCAEVCNACAADCMKLDGMEECVEACRKCAQACREMA